MSNFTFNGVSGSSLGIMLTNTPIRPTWAETLNETIIPGLSTPTYQPSGNYASKSLQLSAVITDTSKIDEIYSKLNGSGKLVLSTDTEKFMNATVNELIPKSVAFSVAEIPINFICKPFAYAVAENLIDIKSYTSYNSIINNGTVYSEPIITFKPIISAVTVLKGDVNFDGKVDAVDASMVMNEYTNVQNGGTPTFTDAQKSAADINGDGRIDATDAAAILQIYTETQSSSINENPSVQVKIYVNGEVLLVGLPSAVVANGYEVTIDSSLQLIYYTNADGKNVNIMQYSYGDLPLLHTGKNYIKYNGDVSEIYIKTNERWL